MYDKQEFQHKVREICHGLAELLIAKNEAYGNSALSPLNCFFKGDATTAIKVRIDDKLSRIMKGKEYGQDDTILDIMGYLVLLKISLEQDMKKEVEEYELPF